MIEFYNKYKYDNNYMKITVSAIDKCNCNCSYCTNIFPRTNKLIDLNQLTKFILLLQKIYNRNIEVSLVGGETMLHQDLYMFCNNMYKINVPCEIFSNFSFDYSIYEKMPPNVTYVLSWHNINNIKFIDNFNKIKDSDIDRYMFSIMFEHDNIDASINIYNIIKKRTPFVAIYLIYDTAQYSKQYTSNQLQLYSNISTNALNININNYQNINKEKINTSIHEMFDFVLNINNNYNTVICDYLEVNNILKSWSCNAGKDLLFISLDGDIYPCSVFYNPHLKSINYQYYLGNIFQLKNVKLKTIISCSSPICCNFGIKRQNLFNQKIPELLKSHIIYTHDN